MSTMGSQVLTAPARGVKRAALDDLDRDQRLSKRFDLLNLDANGSKLYIPIPPEQAGRHSMRDSEPSQPQEISQIAQKYHSDGMEVEDTPNRVYINDLDAEIAELEPSTPSHPIFIPDIEKHLLGLPLSIFAPTPEEEALQKEREKAMQVVIYALPQSLTVSEEQDSVKRAVEDARRRIRQKMPCTGSVSAPPAGPQHWSTPTSWSDAQEDSMDMT